MKDYFSPSFNLDQNKLGNALLPPQCNWIATDEKIPWDKLPGYIII